jgi:NADP-dependent 3-hydroxy acid dehydrogenase YdfG
MTITRNIPDLVVVITGASAGIGYALAKLLAKDGAKVVLAARTEDKLVSVVEECGGITNALAVKCDVTKRSDHEMVLAAAIEKFGRVDCWINNAGVGMSKPVLEITDEDFDLMMSCNCKSVLYGMQTVVPYYKLHGKGQIINVSSVLGRTPYVSVRCMYGASKHAMNALTANMRLDLQNDGFKDIYIGLFSPGMSKTDENMNIYRKILSNVSTDYCTY